MSTLTFGILLFVLVALSVFLGLWIGIDVAQKDARRNK